MPSFAFRKTSLINSNRQTWAALCRYSSTTLYLFFSYQQINSISRYWKILIQILSTTSQECPHICQSWQESGKKGKSKVARSDTNTLSKAEQMMIEKSFLLIPTQRQVQYAKHILLTQKTRILAENCKFLMWKEISLKIEYWVICSFLASSSMVFLIRHQTLTKILHAFSQSDQSLRGNNTNDGLLRRRFSAPHEATSKEYCHLHWKHKNVFEKWFIN